MLVFWSRSGKGTRSLFSFPPSGRDSSPLFWLALLYSPSPFFWTNCFYSDSFSPFCSFGQTISESNSSSLFSSGRYNLRPTSLLQKWSKTIPTSVLASKSIQSHKNILSTIFLLTWKNFTFLLQFFILLPLESKQCPLTLASVLACADSADELLFWSLSGS